jgi:hypothetical protein
LGLPADGHFPPRNTKAWGYALAATSVVVSSYWPFHRRREVRLPFLTRRRGEPVDWDNLGLADPPKDQAFNVQQYGVPEVDLKDSN